RRYHPVTKEESAVVNSPHAVITNGRCGPGKSGVPGVCKNVTVEMLRVELHEGALPAKSACRQDLAPSLEIHRPPNCGLVRPSLSIVAYSRRSGYFGSAPSNAMYTLPLGLLPAMPN